jgi:hypothetical protein
MFPGWIFGNCCQRKILIHESHKRARRDDPNLSSEFAQHIFTTAPKFLRKRIYSNVCSAIGTIVV